MSIFPNYGTMHVLPTDQVVIGASVLDIVAKVKRSHINVSFPPPPLSHNDCLNVYLPLLPLFPFSVVE